MDTEKTKKILSNYVRYYFFIAKTLHDLPKNKKYILLDVGASNKILQKIIPKNINYKSLDLEGKHDYIFNLDKGKIPIKDNFFDIIVCTETLEHTIYPHKVMEELLRITKNDALFILSMPNELNFYIRLQYLLGIKNKSQTPFKTIINHGHIHTPRVKDIINFFPEYVNIKNTYYCWYSRSTFTSKGIKRNFFMIFDSIFNVFSKVHPSLFARNVTVIGKKK